MGLLIDSPAAPPWYANTRSLPFLAGFLASGTVAALRFQIPFAHSLSWPLLFGLALEQLLTVSLVSAITVAALSPSAIYRDRQEFADLVRRASVGALWIAPLILFIREDSYLAIVISAVLALIIASSLQKPREELQNHGEGLLLSLNPDTLPLFPRFGFLTSIFAAMCAQVAIICGLAEQVIIGALLIAIAFATWGCFYRRWRPASQVSRGEAYSSPVFAVVVVYSLMVAGLIPFLRGGDGHGTIASTHHWFSHRRAGGSATHPIPESGAAQRLAGFDSGGSGNRGIVLWPEKKVVTKLVSPSPILEKTLSGHGDANPLIIPFDGVYWFFKSPDIQPPPGSRQARISPEMVDIRSTDHQPLSFEAYDHLANLIDLECCSRVEVAIRNADRYPESVSLELTLMDTTLPHKPSVSLGRMMVNSTPPWKIYEKRRTMEETLKFAIPSQNSLHNFDEIKIVFRLDQARADSAARIAIDHFVLVPRGL